MNDGSESFKTSSVRIVELKDLLGTERQIMIRHGENLYRLMLTRQGKLILNK